MSSRCDQKIKIKIWSCSIHKEWETELVDPQNVGLLDPHEHYSLVMLTVVLNQKRYLCPQNPPPLPYGFRLCERVVQMYIKYINIILKYYTYHAFK